MARRAPCLQGLALAAGCLVLLAACTVRIPADLRTPAVVGVVEEITRLPDGRAVYRLRNGQSAEIASQKEVLLGGEPLVGELLLAGTDPDGRQWIAGLFLDQVPSRPPGCFALDTAGRDAGGWIETTVGLRLPKAAGFDPGPSDGKEFKSDRGMFCVNGEGEATSYGFI